jgi:hypothetical protein
MRIIQTFPGVDWSTRAHCLAPSATWFGHSTLSPVAGCIKWIAPTLFPTKNLQTSEEQQARSVAAVPKESMGKKDCLHYERTWNRTSYNWKIHWEKVLGSIIITFSFFRYDYSKACTMPCVKYL